MTSQSTGIQQLLSAEKKAAEKVSEARKRKAKRLKQAKDEAVEEIEKYRAERERLLKEYEAKYMGSREGVALKIDADTRDKMEEIKTAVETRKDLLINDLLDLVYNIKSDVHRNFSKK
ncbi:PREDICTED: V-type proton ATPase subunit G-like [Rhagoletis zephyria]|uniref:V-type proton ATPase subunit G-like n=1 Tax=Rhagoletis zephyria TaxID=28612 RepID=UPI0008114C02|nr:PREDICTED: V-type proton ATPase subunit G-like [Rhagoletis zephyria]XP_017474070.1 PREDICTED: V-type proton ATPase subunit G-like [Rhagoletis zephyria]XP_036320211.1 V-type proton ATPase subunit G-like [Rhagoletis pomonella]XP_036339345.1 V-type proton ATPase subunit G-like [Rhagoletis pomonella]